MRSLVATLRNSTPVPFVGSVPGRLSNLFVNRNGAAAQMAAMGSVGTLFAVVSRTANATAQVQWKLYRSSPDGDPDNRVEVTRHLALQVLNKPNPFMTRQELMEAGQQHVDLTGEGWCVIDYGGTPWPQTMWPVRPDKMEPVPHPTEYLSGYIYSGPNGEKVPLDRNEVIMLRMPNPLDPYRGMGPVQSLLVDLDATRYSAEWNRAFFLNSAEPGGIIEVEKRLSDPEFQELRMRWNEQHRGVAKAHRVAVLEQGKWVDRSYSQRDMQFAQLRTVSRDTILEAFTMPKSMIGITETVNKANAEVGEVTFARWLQVPRLERWKQAFNNDFLPLFGKAGQGLEFDYVDPVPDDPETETAKLTARANAYVALVGADVEPDDAASVCELPPMRHITPAPVPVPVGAPA